MQNIDPISGPPRRSLDLEDYFDMVRRHFTWILGPAFAGLVIAFVVAFLWPDTYVSVATIRIVPPQVPASLVPTNVAQGMADRINSMYQQITSKSNLANMVNTYNLYPRERQRKPMEDVVEQMRRGINLGAITPIGGDGSRQMAAFAISFTYENRLLAQKVVQDLVSRFMTENTKQRTNQSILTTQFLKDQFDSAKRDLETLESKLVAYRANYQGRLPEQLAQNTMQVSMLEQRAANINNSLARVVQNRMLLESDLRTLKNQKAAIAPTPENQVQRQRNAAIDAQDREIYALENRLTLLRQQYKDTWPDVQATIAQLNTAKAVREKLIARDLEEQPSDAAVKAATRRTDPGFDREQRAVDGSILRLETQLKALTIEEQDYQKDLTNTERQIKEVQSRISAAPASEQQYADLIRDHALAKQKYEDMDHRRSSSEVSEELERRQQGETLELLDPASLPTTPTQPKRQMIIGAGFGIGLALGVALAGAREARDQTLKNLKDCRAYTQLLLLGSIPLLENDVVVRRRRRLAWLAWSTACLVGTMIMTGSVFYYYATKV
jgi:succinoglycan biosynthesis transport protein ExoP